MTVLHWPQLWPWCFASPRQSAICFV